MRAGLRRKGAAFLSDFSAAATAMAALIAMAPPLSALQPVSHFHDLVAGAGVPGYLDGDFQRAQFRAPSGLAVLARRGLVLVADRDNQRIRAIRMMERNRVETVAGTGARGSADGALAQSVFDTPSVIAAISEDAVVVHDEGTALLRLVDLAKGRVETIAGNGGRGVEAGPARSVPLGGIWSLLYVPAENALYFSQPEYHALRRLDLASRSVETVLLEDPSVPRPAALALLGGRVCVADRSGVIARLGPRVPGARSGLEALGRVERTIALAASGELLYAVHVFGDAGEIAWTCVTTGVRVALSAALPDAPPAAWLRTAEEGAIGFAADPGGERSFFLAIPSLHAVVSLKDYRFELSEPGSESGTGLIDFAYPEKKPAGVFRILVLGDSRMFHFALTAPRAPGSEPVRMETVPKRLELFLNSLSALDDGGTRFEVLALLRASWEPLLVWPNYHASDVVRRFDVDLVLLMQPPTTTTVDAYLERPITPAGIPADGIDPEYMLEPHSKKIRGNPAAPFVERARQLGWLKPHGKDQAHVEAEIPLVMTDPAAKRELLALLARPLGMLREGIRGARPETKFALCYFPYALRGSGVAERPFWQELSTKTDSLFFDTVDAFTALKDSWHPYSEPGYEHFSPQGHAFFAFVVAHELIGSGLVPFGKGAAARPRLVPPPSAAASKPPRPPTRLWPPSPALAAAAGAAAGFLLALLLLRKGSTV